MSDVAEAAWRDVCWSLLLPNSTADADWAARCMRGDVGAARESPAVACRVEDVLRRAWCARAWGSVGML